MALLVLSACVQVADERNETVYTPIVMNATKADINITQNVSEAVYVAENVSLNETPDVEFPSEGNFTDLTVGQQHKIIPELERLAQTTECYNLTWAGFDEVSKEHAFEVKKTPSFVYLGGRMFKGYVRSALYEDNVLLDSRTVDLVIEYDVVTCLDFENFTIDWDRTFSQKGNMFR